MARYSSVVTRKGQVTIPAKIRHSLNLNRGDRVEFVLENGSLLLVKASTLVEQTAGMLSKYARNHLPTDEEMNEVIERAIVEDAMRLDTV
jgi:AbrB family looped-hinge helix DNA binding protein